jgi:hypothetical protein
MLGRLGREWDRAVFLRIYGCAAGSDPHCSTRLPLLSTYATQAERRSTAASPENVDMALQSKFPRLEHCSANRALVGIGAVSSGCV